MAQLDVRRKRDLLAYLMGLLITVAVAFLVVLAALDVQSSRMLDVEGLAWRFSNLFVPSPSSTTAWTAIDAGNRLRDPEGYLYLLRRHLVVDLWFIGVYGLIAVIIVLRTCRVLGRVVGLLAVGTLVVADVVEDALAFRAVDRAPVDVEAVTNATQVKGGALLVLVVAVAAGIITQRPEKPSAINRNSLRIAWEAIQVHRLSLVPTVALFVLSVTAGMPLLEQLPDVQRSWIDSGWWSARAAAAIAALAGLTLMIFLTTRVRTGSIRARFAEPDAPLAGARLRYWLVGPLLALGAAVLALTVGRTGAAWSTAQAGPEASPVLTGRLAAFVLPVLVVIMLFSWILRGLWWLQPNWSRPWRPSQPTADDVEAATVVGNIATVALPVVGGLGLIRAFVPVLLVRPLLPTGDPQAAIDPEVADRAEMWVYVGIATIVLPWLVLMLATALGWTTEHIEAWPSARVGWALLAASFLAFFTFGVVAPVAPAAGLAATATVGIGSLTGMVAATGLLMQGHAPAEIFRLIGLHRSPYVSVLVLTLVAVSLASGTGTIHRVDPGPAGALPARTDLESAFTRWAEAPQGCRVPLGDRNVRPMLLIAAEGGGIRAAYWTVRGLQALGEGTCAERAVLFSSGASGGSVGLTVARFSGTAADPGTERAVTAVQKMSDDHTLAAAANSMFVRDTFYGATGVPLPRYGSDEPWRWADRARLIEQGWRDAYGPTGPAWGTRSFLGAPDLSPATGHLVLNSTSAKSNCRVWISQLELPENGQASTAASFDPEHSCDKVPGPGARTIDLFTAYGPLGGPRKPEHAGSCLRDVSAVTAALLTARFPYVTPGGVVGPCPDNPDANARREPYWPSTQLVDGGYLENSGLATVTDLASEWLPRVRAHNERAIRAGSGLDLVVPIVVYFANGDPTTTRPRVNEGPTDEISLPLRTYLRGGRSLSQADALLERAREVVQLEGFCPTPQTGSTPDVTCAELDQAFDQRVIVVDRVAKPEVSAPLGWSLSGSTRKTLEAAIAYQSEARCDRGDPPPTCALDYAPLGELRRDLGAEG